MKKVMAIGSGNRPGVVPIVIGLTVSLLLVPFLARGAGSAKNVYPPSAHRLPDKACSSAPQPPRFDKAIRDLPSYRSPFQPHSSRCRESSADLAYRINKLSRDASPSGRRELATVVNLLPKNQRFHDAAPKDMALLTNGISKLLDRREDCPVAIRVLNTLAREVCRRNLRDRPWQSQTLAMVVNGLSKAKGGDITGALQAVAREIVHRNLGHWTPQNLALVVCGLRKHEGEEITDCSNVLAREIGGQDLYRWQSRHLAMAASGICRAEGKALTMALTGLAREVIDRKPELGRWTKQHLAMVIGGLSKGEGDQITKALNVLAQTVNRRQGKFRWTEQDLAVIVSGLSRGEGDEITGALSALAEVVTERKRELDRWAEQHLAMVVSGLSKGEGAEIVNALSVLAEAMTDRKHELSQWKQQHLAMVVSGFSKKGTGAEITKVLSTLAKAVIDRSQELNRWTGQQLAMVVNGLSRETEQEMTKALGVLAKTVVDRKRQLGRWTEQQLAMVVNGLSKGEEAEVTGALSVLAKEVVDRKQELGQWTAQHLAMVISGLSKGRQEEITKALGILAEAVTHRQQELGQWTTQTLAKAVNGFSKGTGEQITRALNMFAKAVVAQQGQLDRWTEQHLAMVVSGLSRGAGVDITRALSILAQAVADRQRELGQWTRQHLAMVIDGLGKGSGEKITRALGTLAQAVNSRKQELNLCTAQNLAILTYGLSNGVGVEITNCLKTLAREVAICDLSQWTLRDLAMAASGLGQVPQEPGFNKLISELIKRAPQEPSWLLIPLKALCRLQLSRKQVDTALSLLDALHQSGYRPNGRDTQNELLWCSTLVHFSNQHLLAASNAPRDHSDRLAKLHRHSVEIADWGESDGSVDPKAYDQGCAIKQDMDEKPWHGRFARDYWQHEHQQQSKGLPARPAVSSFGNGQPAPSQMQFNIYQTIKTALSQASRGRQNPSNKIIEMEASINHFPVDILIDGRICIEVDGPTHYLQPEQNPDSQSRGTAPEHGDSALSVLPSLPGERRAKDRFIDHMLEQYGYRVFRIPYTYRPESPEFREIIHQIQTSLTEKK